MSQKFTKLETALLFNVPSQSHSNYSPVSCHHEQISGPLDHWDCRHFLFSRGRCILLVPAWKCAFFCQWSSGCHSTTNKERKALKLRYRFYVTKQIYPRCQLMVSSALQTVLLTGSHFPMSPVCSHPSWSIASAVFSGSFRYPWNTFGPLTHT